MRLSTSTKGTTVVVAAVGILSLAGATAAQGAGAAPGAQVTQRVSVNSHGGQADGGSGRPTISASGRYVAFESLAANLVPHDTNGLADVFVRDRSTHRTVRASLGAQGVQGNGDSGQAAISATGRYVAFTSNASNLVPGDTNGRGDIFLRDLTSGTTRRVSVSTAGGQANGDSYDPVISANGRFVAFTSDATNLVGGDTNGRTDVFLRDLVKGTTTRISVNSTGIQGNGLSYSASISATGRYVAFTSDATNLVPGDTNGHTDVFLRDLATSATTRLSVSSAGAQGAGDSYFPFISADGRSIAFTSTAANLVPGDTNAAADVFVRSRTLGVTRRVSLGNGGGQGNASSYLPVLSAHGRYVVFVSSATNLVPGDTNQVDDVYARDRATGRTWRVSVSTSGAQGNDQSVGGEAVSAHGTYIAFTSRASNLVRHDTNDLPDVFVHGPAVRR